MGEIAVAPIEILIKGIPETVLFILAIHIFINLKVDYKKSFIIFFISMCVTYMTRFLPIGYVVHLLISITTWVLYFQLVYCLPLSKAGRVILSVSAGVILIVIAEMINCYLLQVYFGPTMIDYVFSVATPLAKCLYMLPSTVIFGILVLIIWLILKRIRSHKKKIAESRNE